MLTCFYRIDDDHNTWNFKAYDKTAQFVHETVWDIQDMTNLSGYF